MKDGLIDRAVSYIQCTGFSFSKHALNIGPRNFDEPEYLSTEYGFVVDAVDKENIGTSQNSNITVYQSLIEDFDFTDKSYHFVLAKNVFYFLSKEPLIDVFENIKKHLSKGGVFYFSVLGKNDAWVSENNRDYFEKQEIINLFQDFECLNYLEKEGFGKLYSGDEKYWHTLSFIMRKK